MSGLTPTPSPKELKALKAKELNLKMFGAFPLQYPNWDFLEGHENEKDQKSHAINTATRTGASSIKQENKKAQKAAIPKWLQLIIAPGEILSELHQGRRKRTNALKLILLTLLVAALVVSIAYPPVLVAIMALVGVSAEAGVIVGLFSVAMIMVPMLNAVGDWIAKRFKMDRYDITSKTQKAWAEFDIKPENLMKMKAYIRNKQAVIKDTKALSDLKNNIDLCSPHGIKKLLAFFTHDLSELNQKLSEAQSQDKDQIQHDINGLVEIIEGFRKGRNLPSTPLKVDGGLTCKALCDKALFEHKVLTDLETILKYSQDPSKRKLIAQNLNALIDKVTEKKRVLKDVQQWVLDPTDDANMRLQTMAFFKISEFIARIESLTDDEKTCYNKLFTALNLEKIKLGFDEEPMPQPDSQVSPPGSLLTPAAAIVPAKNLQTQQAGNNPSVSTSPEAVKPLKPPKPPGSESK